MELVLHCAFMNNDSEQSPDDLLHYIKSRTSDVDFYKPIPKPGVIQSASFDWQALLPISVDIIQVASAIWEAHRHFANISVSNFKPHNQELTVMIGDAGENTVHLTLNGESTDKQEFIVEFTESIKTIKATIRGKESESVKREVTMSGNWKRV